MAEPGWLVVTGAASGIMEAGHRGAGREYSMGLNIMLPFEQSANPVIAGDPKLVHMKYFFTRKLMFVKECDAVVPCPAASARSTKAWKCSRCCKPATQHHSGRPPRRSRHGLLAGPARLREHHLLMRA